MTQFDIGIKYDAMKGKKTFLRIGFTTLFVFVLFGGIFTVTQSKDPYISELAFIEGSVGNVGSVIPASCNSNPPANHNGNCPPQVEVNISDKPNTITASFTNAWPTISWYGNAVQVSPNNFKIGDNNDWTNTSSIQMNVSYTSGGATRCWLYRESTGWVNAGTSGTFTTNVSTGGTTQFALNCSDGVYWRNVQGSIYGEWNSVRQDNG